MSDAARAKLVRIIYMVLYAYFLLLVLCVPGCDRGYDLCNKVGGYGTWSFHWLIPVVGTTLWILNRPVRHEHSRWQRVGIFWSGILLVPVWFYVGTLADFVGRTMHATYPYILETGPDTEYTATHFKQKFGYPVPSNVSNLYFVDRGFVGGHAFYSRFQTSNIRIVSNIVSQLQLTNGAPSDGWKELTKFNDTVSWWGKNQNEKGLHFYGREGTNGVWHVWRMWHDPTTRTVWYYDEEE